MASKSGSIWAIDIGDSGLKALRLRDTGDGVVEVIGFDNIQHGKILAGSGVKAVERDELIALSLRQFVSKNDLGKDDVIISVPSQNSFARFVSLPPVEQKRIPEIVKFEAAQQIPFDIDDVQWDWQQMTEPGSGEIKVGLFAIKNDIVSSALEHFSRENIKVKYVQMTPMALYNYVLYDRTDLGDSEDSAIVILDINAENTDLVVCTKSSVWQRVVPIGGNAFTKAVAETFKLNFEKAEKLKRTAPMSKYARQIFQAMRPVFTDLASEVQRSLGFYSSSNPSTKLTKVVAFGGGTKMRGLLKYLQQSLQMPVERPDAFNKLEIKSDVTAAKFHENVSDFGVVYGLGLQGLELARIESNLLPRSIARSMAWAGKAKLLTFATCVLLLVSVLSFGRTFLDYLSYNRQSDLRKKISKVIGSAKEADDKLKEQAGKGPDYETIVKKEFDYFEHRDVVALLNQTIISSLPNEKNNPSQKEFYMAFAGGDVGTILETARKERKQIFVTSMSISYTDDLATAKFADGSSRRGTTSRGYDSAYDDEDSEDGKKEDVKEEVIEEGPGFLVTITGYSPYASIGELMDPAGVENDMSKWGVVTRFLRLDDIVDGNSPFKLYKKAEIEHFSLETGEVSIGDSAMPTGIGMEEVGDQRIGRPGERMLVDPMTKEIISKISELDEFGREKIDRAGNVIYQANDHWFRLNAKFLWRDALNEDEE